MTGIEYQLIRPLDFVVVADHAESYGLLDFIALGPFDFAGSAGQTVDD